MTSAPHSSPHSRATTLLWGIFLACSWTWCIGMYLPVIMITRFGWPGFIAFAVPNVLGCAAFGYVLKTRMRSEQMVARHGSAMVWFSIITVAYQVFFVAWLCAEVISMWTWQPWLPLTLLGATMAIGFALSALRDRAWLAVAAITYAISLAVLALIDFRALHAIEWHGEWEPSKLIWLAPTLFFGFLLCPYLDLTFHRALQRSPSRHSFAVFGAAFFVMIFLTCMVWFSGATGMPVALPLFVLPQATFTIGAHLREIRFCPAIRSSRVRTIAMIAPLGTALLVYLPDLLPARLATDQTGIYLRFLVFYGLVFPAYVMLLIFARRTSRRDMRAIAIFAGMVLVSLPLYEMGFIRGRTELLIIPLALIIIAAAWLRMNEKTPGKARG